MLGSTFALSQIHEKDQIRAMEHETEGRPGVGILLQLACRPMQNAGSDAMGA